MEILIMIIGLILSGILFLYMRKNHKISLGYGISFLVFLGFISLSLIYIGYDRSRVILLLGASPILVLIGLPFYIFSFIIVLISTGIKLVKREGKTLSHLLSFSLGIFLILWTYFYPVMISKIDNIYIQALSSFISAVIGYFILLVVLYYITGLLNAKPMYGKKYDYIIVLGSRIIDGKVPPLLANRIDAGMEVYNRQIEEGYKTKMIFSGGMGKDELVAEGVGMRDYAIKKGIDEKYAIAEDKSKTTRENLLFSKKIIDKDLKEENISKNPNILIATNNYHVLRALFLGKDLGIKADGVGGKTPFYFWINALIREMIALIFMNKKFHIVVVIIIFILNLFSLVGNMLFTV